MAEGRAPNARQRALRLLLAGLAGAVAAWIAAAIGFVVVVGGSAMPAVVVAGVITIGFFSLGQAVQVALARAEPVVVMMASVVSYLFRVIAVAWVAMWILTQWPALDGRQLGVTILIVLSGWLAAEVFAFARMRVPAFDPPQGETD